MGVVASYETTDRSVAVGDKGTQTRITNLIARRNRKSEGVIMKIRFMFYKAVSLFCFVAFIFVCFVPEGYSQTRNPTERLFRRTEGRQNITGQCCNTVWAFALWTGNSALA